MQKQSKTILPQVDAYVNGATGHDWTADETVNPEAKAAARIYLVLLYDLMSMQQNQTDALNRALASSLARLEAQATSWLIMNIKYDIFNL